VEEPIVDVRIMAPMDYAGNIMDLIKRKRGTDMETRPIDESTWLFTAVLPWGEVVTRYVLCTYAHYLFVSYSQNFCSVAFLTS
jgi:translation elongation factor EF-4